MTYDEAQIRAQEWTAGVDPNQSGWRPVMLLLLQRIKTLEISNQSLHEQYRRVKNENDALSLDLGIKDQAFTPQMPKDPT